jgi:hypothetical protein
MASDGPTFAFFANGGTERYVWDTVDSSQTVRYDCRMASEGPAFAFFANGGTERYDCRESVGTLS